LTGGIYRALLESLCFGARSILDQFLAGGFPIERIALTSGLARNTQMRVTPPEHRTPRGQ